MEKQPSWQGRGDSKKGNDDEVVDYDNDVYKDKVNNYNEYDDKATQRMMKIMLSSFFDATTRQQ